MVLSREQFNKAIDALLSAFPQKAFLTQMVQLQLDTNMEEIATGYDTRDIVLNLLIWAERNGRLDDLIKGALEEVPDNAKLQDLSESWQPTSNEPKQGIANSPNNPKVFVSYLREDQALVKRVISVLEDRNIEVWWDKTEIKLGDNWKKAIRNGIRKGSYFIACFSSAYGKRANSYMQAELGIAMEEMRNRPDSIKWFIPVMLDDSSPPDIWLNSQTRLQDIHYASLSKEWSDGMSQILSVLGVNEGSNYSTGALVEVLSSVICDDIKNGRIASIEELIHKERDIASSHYRGMLGLHHFIKIGEGYPIDFWPEDTKLLSSYFDDFSSWARATNRKLPIHSIDLLNGSRTLIITDYSRAILSALEAIAPQADNIEITLINRDHRLVQSGEVKKLEPHLLQMGFKIVDRLNYSQWMSLLSQIVKREQRYDLLLFGAEAVLPDGSILFPQKLRASETKLLQQIAKSTDSIFPKIACIAESYKFVNDSAEDEISDLVEEDKFILIPHEYFSEYVTDFKRISFQPNTQKNFREIHAYVNDQALVRFERFLPKLTKGLPFHSLSLSRLYSVRLIASDVDDTITKDGKITARVLSAIEALHDIDVELVLVTGRSAAWCQSLMSYLPKVKVVIGENGGIIVDESGYVRTLVNVTDELNRVAKLINDTTILEYTEDNFSRITDRTFTLVNDFDLASVQQIVDKNSNSLEVITSTIHLHVRSREATKANGLKSYIKELGLEPQCILTIGDSMNDAELFSEFPISVGVANVQKYLSSLGNKMPKYICNGEAGDGFLEVLERIGESRVLLDPTSQTSAY